MFLPDDTLQRVIHSLELHEKITDYLRDAAFLCEQNAADFKASFKQWQESQPHGALEGAMRVHALARQGRAMPWSKS